MYAICARKDEWRKSSEVGPNTIILHIIECNPLPKMRGYLVATNKGVIYVCVGLSKSMGYSIECEEKSNLYRYKGATILKIEELEYETIGLRIKTDKGDIDIWGHDNNEDRGFYSSDVVIKVLHHEEEWFYS